MRSRKLSRRRGFTLLEVLIAAMLLVVALVGSIALILGLLQANRTARARDTGYFLAQQALDQLGMVPIVGPAGNPAYLSNNPLYTGAPVPSAPTCYPMSDDVIIDRPVPCAAGLTSAFVVRTWTCCNTTTGVTPASPLAAGVCGATQPALQSPNVLQQSGVCYVQAEVTWPVEDPVGHNLLAPALASQEALFQDTLPAATGVTFGSHIWAAMVREE